MDKIKTKYTKNEQGETQQIELWHRVNGVWVHIVQILEDGEVKYFTDGIEQNEGSTWTNSCGSYMKFLIPFQGWCVQCYCGKNHEHFKLREYFKARRLSKKRHEHEN